MINSNINHAVVHTGNQQNRAGIHTQIIYNTGPIQEIQQATEVVGKEDHHVFDYIVIYSKLDTYVKTTHKMHLPNTQSW